MKERQLKERKQFTKEELESTKMPKLVKTTWKKCTNPVQYFELDESSQNFDLIQGKYLSENYLQQIVDSTKLKYGLIKIRGPEPINPALI